MLPPKSQTWRATDVSLRLKDQEIWTMKTKDNRRDQTTPGEKAWWGEGGKEEKGERRGGRERGRRGEQEGGRGRGERRFFYFLVLSGPSPAGQCHPLPGFSGQPSQALPELKCFPIHLDAISLISPLSITKTTPVIPVIALLPLPSVFCLSRKRSWCKNVHLQAL